MADALRAWRGVAEIHRQRLRRPGRDEPRDGRGATEGAATMLPCRFAGTRGSTRCPQGPLILLANEFIDALPIRQFVRRGKSWRERLVASDGKGGFAFVEGDSDDAEDQRMLRARLRRKAPSSKRGPAATQLLRELARRAARAPLAALIIDYGHAETGFGDTLQAVRGHRFADPLADPGDSRSLRPCRFRRSRSESAEALRTERLWPDAARRVPAQARPWPAPRAPA